MSKDDAQTARKYTDMTAFVLGFAGSVAAQEAKDADTKADPKNGGGDLTTAATNPVGSVTLLQLQNLYIPNSDNSSGAANTGIIQPVVPFNLPEDGYFQGNRHPHHDPDRHVA